MKNSSLVFFTLVSFAWSSCNSGGNDKANPSDTPAVAASPTAAASPVPPPNSDYTIPFPHSWSKEIHPFPLDFAPEIPFKGYADVRFPPGWPNSASDEFWSYMGVWWLTDTPQINEKTLTRTLVQYYTGFSRKSRPGTIPAPDSATLAKAKVKKTKTDSSDIATYNASASIYEPVLIRGRMDVNFKIHVIACPKGKATVVILEISPKDYPDNIWQTMDKIETQFKCTD